MPDKYKSSGARNVCFTLNNYTDSEYETVIGTDCKYIIVGKEVGENGTPHLQGYIEFNGVKKFTTLKAMWPRAHFEKRKGTAKQAAEYCMKDGNYCEIGVRSTQGERTDIEEVRDEILDGRTTSRDIRQENPHFFHQYGRTLERLENDRQEMQARTRETKGIWLWGTTGTGKSELAFKDYNPNTHYVWKLNDNDWQDGYRQQPIVIIDDFRGNIPYDEILRMVDRWPNYHAKRRGQAPLPFTSKLVIITSSLPPEEVYNRRNARDSIEQLHRRFRVFHTPYENDLVSEVLRVILQPEDINLTYNLTEE